MLTLPAYYKALVFDMDGTMIHNKPYHDAAWVEFCNRHSVHIELESFCKAYTGKTNAVILEMIFGSGLSTEQILAYESEKELIYRELYAPHFKLIQGLPELLQSAKQLQILLAVGTSAPVVNVDFVLHKGAIFHFFDTIVHSAMVSQGKPSPEIFLKAAELLHIQPTECMCFEDSFAGIEASRAAGMYTIGIASEQSKHTLLQAGAHEAYSDFTEFYLHYSQNT
ncbi:MAG TPA: HAD family phosphatase [Bacteroidales bacterium]|nr:MAG: Fructose-1-phosphate phosphatase YqaB [Bacteroidetes bacterium ADurb.Bin217]HOS84549.1 HAD family phosphatase [Bacteroidales bacterium]HPM11988.1 HAD family phosphatase [Bacteroidales bacterium]